MLGFRESDEVEDLLCIGVTLLGIRPGSGTGGLPDTEGGGDEDRTGGVLV